MARCRCLALLACFAIVPLETLRHHLALLPRTAMARRRRFALSACFAIVPLESGEGRRCFSCRRAPSPHQGRAPPSPRTQVTAALVARRRSSARRQSWETSLSLSCLKAVIAFPATELLRYRIEAKHRSSFAAASRPSTEVGKLTRSGWKTNGVTRF
uniref:Secreted protein n=2 Tax=Oryza sativa subsp. japonica TaxID=39947 RepID=Q9AV78_ORYSJ|nr:hypothetical protein [Oryza sativa Japonica Group]AAP54195.1 hypothetical protein LOC_Os10g32910 [Oryza sativa Japonica Group]